MNKNVIIMSVIAVVMVAVVWFVNRRYSVAQLRKRTNETIRLLNVADAGVGEYVMEMRKWPKSIDDVEKFLSDREPSGEPLVKVFGHGVQRLVKKDAWGNEIALTIRALENRELMAIGSPGRNGKIGDEDDIVKWWPVHPAAADPNHEIPYLKASDRAVQKQ